MDKQKLFVVIVYVAIGALLSYLFHRYQVRQHTQEYVKAIAPEARRLDLLAMIAIAQERFREDRVRDENGNGVGEFGTMADLLADRGEQPSYVQRIFDRYYKGHALHGDTLAGFALETDGSVKAADYIYAVSLPDIVLGREGNWCAFAHPQVYGEATCKTYFLDGRAPDRVYSTHHDAYQGCGSGPTPAAAYEGAPFRGEVRGIALPSQEERDREERMEAVLEKIKKSKGTLWGAMPLVYPEGYTPRRGTSGRD